MRVAAIDLGTNSFLCLIADMSASSSGPRLEVVSDTCQVVRLGERVHEKRMFVPEALARAEKCLDEFECIIKTHKAEKVIATATSAARDASNGQALIDMGRKRGIPIHIIGGPREAELSFDGAISGIDDAGNKKILVVDVGGGSTELIFKKPGHPIKGTSFDVGCVRLTEMFLKNDPPKKSELAELTQYAAKIMGAYGRVDPDLVIAVAGTPTTLACVAQKIDFDESRVEGYTLTRKQIGDLAESLGAMPMTQRKAVKGMEPLRADVIVAGGVLLDRALELAGKSEMRVSTRGVRFGVALHYKEFSN